MELTDFDQSNDAVSVMGVVANPSVTVKPSVMVTAFAYASVQVARLQMTRSDAAIAAPLTCDVEVSQ